MIHSLLQIIIVIGKNSGNGGNIDLRFRCFQRHQFKYLLKKSIWKSALQVHSWPLQVMYRIFICHRTFIEALDIYFHIIQCKYGLIEKEIPILLLVSRVLQVKDISHPISGNVLMTFILVESYVCFSLYFSSWKRGSCMIYFLFSLRACSQNLSLWRVSCQFWDFLLYYSPGKIQ